MKKKVLCIFVLIFWLVGACTFLSQKVEKQMVAQVITLEPNGGMGSGSDTLPLECLMMGENGMTLYSLYEGTGWEAGTRVQEESGGWQIDEDGIKLESAWGTYVQYASKPLKSGEIVEQVLSGRPQPDHWLAVLPSEVELNELPEGVEIVEQSGSAVLFSVEKAMGVFMEAQAKTLIPQLYEAKVYSFRAMSQFLDNFTGLGQLLFLLGAALALWVGSCLFARKARQNRAVLVLNLAVGLVLLACVPLVLQSIDLPSSLLPRLHITDFGYYAQEIEEFFGSLLTFAPEASAQGYLAPNLPQSQVGQAIIQQRNITIARPFLYGAGGLALGALTALGEYCVLKVRRRPRIK